LIGAFQIGVEPSRSDLLQGIAGVTFEDAWKDRFEGRIDDETPAQFISREDLIRNKLAVGWHQDLADVEKLKEARPDRK
jgi:hypothetical protein